MAIPPVHLFVGTDPRRKSTTQAYTSKESQSMPNCNVCGFMLSKERIILTMAQASTFPVFTLLEVSTNCWYMNNNKCMLCCIYMLTSRVQIWSYGAKFDAKHRPVPMYPTCAHVVQNHMHVHVIYIYRDVIGCRVNTAEYMFHCMWF